MNSYFLGSKNFKNGKQAFPFVNTKIFIYFYDFALLLSQYTDSNLSIMFTNEGVHRLGMSISTQCSVCASCGSRWIEENLIMTDVLVIPLQYRSSPNSVHIDMLTLYLILHLISALKFLSCGVNANISITFLIYKGNIVSEIFLKTVIVYIHCIVLLSFL